MKVSPSCSCRRTISKRAFAQLAVGGGERLVEQQELGRLISARASARVGAGRRKLGGLASAEPVESHQGERLRHPASISPLATPSRRSP